MYGCILTMVTRSPRLSSSAPIDAAARPLPSEETTPPVTKMYFVFVICPLVIRSSLARRGRREKAAHLLEVFWRIDADRVVRALNGLDPDAMFERAKLFQG